MLNMNLSVIIPCFNAANTIAVQLEALANQEWSEPWEVIVSDNGSTDNSVEIVEQYKERLPHLRIVNASDRKGAAHARNVGATAAKAEALAFCDADDEVAPGWVAAMGKALLKYNFVACRLDLEKLNEPWMVKYHPHPQEKGLQTFGYPSYLPHAGSCGIGVKRTIHEEVGGFDEALLRHQDTDYCWKIHLAGTELHFVPDAVVHYRYRPNLKELYRQRYLWAEYEVMLYKKYRQLGMPKLSWKRSVRSWLGLFIRLPQILYLGSRSQWLANFACRWGRMQGSIKYKIWAL